MSEIENILNQQHLANQSKLSLFVIIHIPTVALYISYRTSVVKYCKSRGSSLVACRKDERALPRNRKSGHPPSTVARNTSLLKRRRYVRNSSSTILHSSILHFTRIWHPCCSADPISYSPPSSLQRPVIGPALSDWSQSEFHPHPLHLRRVPQLLLLPSSLQPL